MQRRLSAFITFFIIALIHAGCSSISDKNWTNLIPSEVSFVVVPDSGLTLEQLPSQTYASGLDDLTSDALQQIAAMDSVVSEDLRIKALALYPTTASTSDFIWITDNPAADIEQWAYRFYQPFTQNNYSFQGHRVHKLYFNQTTIFASQAGPWLVLSSSSLAVENALRSYTGDRKALNTGKQLKARQMVINFPEIDEWIEQFTTVSNRPSIHDAFAGSGPVVFDFPAGETFSLKSTMSLDADTHSVLTDALTFENRPITLDRYVAGNAAAFALFRLPPVSVPARPEDGSGKLDSLLLENLDRYQQLSETMDSPFAFEAFPESGLMSDGEFLFIRKLKDPEGLQMELDRLEEEDQIEKSGDSYQVSSRVLARLIGSEMCPFSDFYLSITGEAAVMARRRGLAEGVELDRSRRRVMYYDDTYSGIRSDLPDELSGFAWAESQEFLKFLKPLLRTDNIAGGLLNRFDITTMMLERESDEQAVMTIETHKLEGSSRPYEELWVLPIADRELSGTPVLGNLAGSAADEVIISTTDGQVIALAADGTTVMQASTGGEVPVGSPVIYDWYGTGQHIVLQAAGNKVFAWNEAGRPLPNFPIQLSEQISSPMLVTDVLRNGIPEIVLATMDRKLHVLDGRGNNVRGWPQNTNALVQNRPSFEFLKGQWNIWAFSQNALHAWQQNGNPREGFPQFINAGFTGSPLVFDEQTLGGAADGYLYSIGENTLFSDTAGTYLSTDSIRVQTMYISGNELMNTSLQPSILLRDSTGFYREDLITTQSRNGSVFLYNKNGTLRFTQSMGQPASGSFTPTILDINGDDRDELLALADFGRLYAWEILSGERIYGLPTSGLKYPVITDLNADGRKELIAQTREGLRCWTINRE